MINSVTLSYQVNGGDLTATDSVEFLASGAIEVASDGRIAAVHPGDFRSPAGGPGSSRIEM